MRKLTLPMLLLCLAVTVNPSAQPQRKKLSSENVFGIDLERTYSGNEVDEMLSVIAEETDRAIEESYAEGFKAAALRYAPETAYFSDINENLAAENERLSRQCSRSVPLWHVPLFCCAGIMLGYGIRVAGEKLR